MAGDCIWECGIGQIKGFPSDTCSLRSRTLRIQLSVNAGVEVGSTVHLSEDADSSVLC